MKKISQYEGNLLNHVETLYRPGERGLAVALAEALGCTISDTGFVGDGDETFLAAHPWRQDLDVQRNVFYMSPMRPEQSALEARLRAVAYADPLLADALDSYRAIARTKPFGVPHFAIRYPSGDEVREAATRVEQTISSQASGRAHVRIFAPGEADAAVGNLVQAFIYQDIIVSGSFLHGQLIELQSLP